MGQSTEDANDDGFEEKHVRFLIISVARRTNSFRISTYITKVVLWGIALLALIGGSVIVAHYHCPENPAGELVTSATPPGRAKVVLNISGGDVHIEQVQPLDSEPPKLRPSGGITARLDPKLESAIWDHLKNSPDSGPPTGIPSWIILTLTVLTFAVLIAAFLWSLSKKPEATPVTIAIATLTAVSAFIEKGVARGQIPALHTLPFIVVVVAGLLAVSGAALIAEALWRFYGLRGVSADEQKKFLFGAALLIFGFSAALLALMPPLLFRGEDVAPQPCPKCVVVTPAGNLEVFPLDPIDKFGNGHGPKDRIIPPNNLVSELRDQNAHAGDKLLLFGSADCVRFTKDRHYNNKMLAKDRANWVKQSIPSGTLDGSSIETFALRQHEGCKETKELRVVFPFLIHSQNNRTAR